MIEAYGTGLGKIMKAYEDVEEKPTIENTKNAFKIILPNINAKYEKGNAATLQSEMIANTVVTDNSQSDEEKVLEYTRSHGVITRNTRYTVLK